jgi:hypothetical protein
MNRKIGVLLVLSIAFLVPNYGLCVNLDGLKDDLTKTENRLSHTDEDTRSTLGEVGTSTVEKLQTDWKQLETDAKGWDENLDVGTSAAVDVEAKRKKLRNNVEIWTATIGVTEIGELKQGIADGLAVAKADGTLDINKLTEIYELTKKVIRGASFEIPENSVFQRIERLNLETDERITSQIAASFLRLIQMGFAVEELEAQARADLMEYRVDLYKRAAVAFIRALISGNIEPTPCPMEQGSIQEVTIRGKQLYASTCADPVVDNLRAYLNAVRNIQSAETHALAAKTEELILEQEVVVFIASFVPVLGDSVDLLAAITGEDLAGYCLNAFERIIAATLTLIPMVGPDLFEAAMRRSKRFRESVVFVYEYLNLYLRPMQELPGDLAWAYKQIGFDVSDRMAKRWGTTVPALMKVRDLFARLVRGVELDDAARARMRTFRTVRDALDDAEWLGKFSKEVQEKAVARSARRMADNLGAAQGTRTARMQASHMVPKHLENLEELARDKDWILMYRSVNSDATELIARNYATKGMNVKGKSADWGAHAGFIPVEQKYSKLGNPNRVKAGTIDAEEIGKFHKKVRECLEAAPPCANKTKLVVGGKPVMIVEDTGGREITALFDSDTGRYLDRSGNDITSTVNTGKPARPMEVLADDKGNALTADYDFLDFGWKGKHDTPNFKQDKGYITRRQEEMLEAANARVTDAGYEGGNISHHGAERWYPFSPGAMEVDEVITVLDPEAGLVVIPRCDSSCMKRWCETTGLCDPTIICGGGSASNCIPPDPNRLLKDYMHDKRVHGYNIGPNPIWNWGHYNPLEGWSFAQYLGNMKSQGGVNLHRGPRFAVTTSGPAEVVIDYAHALASGQVGGISKHVLSDSIPKCRQRPVPSEGGGR